MHRSKVKKQYRRFIRLAASVDGGDAGGGECRAAAEEVRTAYRLGMSRDTDTLSKNMAFAEGERRLKEMEAIAGHSSGRRRTPGPEAYDEDSWINIKDDQDQRGRVGVQWPWQAKGDE